MRTTTVRGSDPRARFIQDGAASVSSERLVVLLYERLLRDLDDADQALSTGEIHAGHEALVHAQQIVEELAFAVRPESWEGGKALLDLYDYVLDRLVTANVTKSPAGISEARTVILQLHDAWDGAYRSLQSGTA